MTLPITLLPAGALDAMRSTSNLFMNTPAVLYNIIKNYSIYGELVQTSGVLWSGSVYIGDISARDVELLRSTDFYVSRNDGREIKYLATILLPFNVDLQTYNSVKVSNKDWEIIWHNKLTSSGVILYTKTIVRDKYYE